MGRLQQGAGVLTADTDGEGRGGGIAWGQTQCGEGDPAKGSFPCLQQTGKHSLRSPKLITCRGLGAQSSSHPPWGPWGCVWGDHPARSPFPPPQTEGFWGGSFSPQDFSDPALVLFEAMDFEEGPSVELSEALPDTQLAGYGTVTQSIHVLSGV